MNGNVYKVEDIVGSGDTIETAIKTAVDRAAKTTRNLEWFKVTELRGYIQDGSVAGFQVCLELGFRLDDPK